jgi:BREX system ATP-binding protein BrxC/D
MIAKDASTTKDVARRRAIEALRAGVPSRDAVEALGSGQGEIEDRFGELRGAVTGGTSAGLLIGGGFGSGKSHLLEHLAHLALGAGFTVSRVVISKEVPLHDAAKVFQAAVTSAVTDGRPAAAIADAAARLDVDGRGYAELLRWASSSGSGLNERFAATLALYAHIRERDAAFANAIVRFWSGDPIGVAELRRRLKEIGEARPSLPPVAAKELARQRLRFVARLLTATGSAGWIILFDEVELIGRYSLQQRARSYAEIARWVRGDHGAAGLPLGAVLAMTDDFEAAVISGRNDRELVPAKLRDKGTPEAVALAAAAQQGMRIVDREMTLLRQPDSVELDQAYARLKDLHGEVFGWQPPDVAGLERLGATRMRQYVRAWINEWDLIRLDPAYAPESVAVDVASDYRESPDLEIGTDTE